MARIYDFNNFSSSSGSREDYEFRYELDFTDTTVVNPPEELKNLDTASVNVTYKSSVKIDKNGIYDIDFSISEMEIRFEMDDYPNESIIEEIELKPGVNIPRRSDQDHQGRLSNTDISIIDYDRYEKGKRFWKILYRNHIW
jgi:hypothetical protein